MHLGDDRAHYSKCLGNRTGQHAEQVSFDPEAFPQKVALRRKCQSAASWPTRPSAACPDVASHLVCEKRERQPLLFSEICIDLRRVAADAEHLGASVLEHCMHAQTLMLPMHMNCVRQCMRARSGCCHTCV